MRTFKSLCLVTICLSFLAATSCKMMADLVPNQPVESAAASAKDATPPTAPANITAHAEADQPTEQIGQWPQGERFDGVKPPAKTGGAAGINGGVQGTDQPSAGPGGNDVQKPSPSMSPAEEELLKIIRVAADTPESQKLVEAMVEAFADKPDRAITLLDQYGNSAPADKKMLVQMLRGYVSMKLGNMDEALKTLDELHRTLREQMPLAIVSPKLCRKVESYGRYDEFGHYVFPSGKTVILYFEPQYFVCAPVNEQYLVSLNAKYAITDKDGNQVWQAEDSISHKTTHYLYDLFMTRKIVIPALPDGNYTLKIMLQDMNKTDQEKPIESEVKFEISHDMQ